MAEPQTAAEIVPLIPRNRNLGPRIPNELLERLLYDTHFGGVGLSIQQIAALLPKDAYEVAAITNRAYDPDHTRLLNAISNAAAEARFK